MTPRFVPLDLPRERSALIALLTGDEWPFHVHRRPTPAQAIAAIEGGSYDGEGSQAFWIQEGAERVGLVTLRELEDPTPVFDLRLRTPHRGRGLGRAAVTWLAERTFTATGKLRLEGHTRADNLAMRRVLRACGWVKEAHHRRAWPDHEGGWHDAVTYTVLKEDWLSGAVTPVPFHDE